MTNITILVIDDDKVDRLNFIRLLKDYPHGECTILEAASAKEAISLCKKNNVDCVLVDYELPDINGISLIKILKESLNEFIPIIMLTGQGNESIAVAAMKEGITDYLIKSQITKHILAKTLISAIEKSQLEMKIHEQEKQLEHQAFYDGLTGLMNRHSFSEAATRDIANAIRHNKLLALLFLDLDNFKTINDTLGHFAGDELLKEVGNRIAHVLRREDLFARFGGDEFVILLNELNSIEDITMVSKKIIKSLGAPFQIGINLAHIGASIGIAHFPACGNTLTELLKNADIALYKAKTKGRANYQIFSEKLKKVYEQRLCIEQGLHLALKNKELFLLYQPKFELKTKKIIGMEALLRWNHPQIGVIMPDHFIPIAEKTGLIIPIGQWILETACHQFDYWKKTNKNLSLSIAINLSTHQLSNDFFLETIKKLLDSIQTQSKFIELEITESSLMREAENDSILNSLSEISLQLTIDDFGRGYSSLDRLKHLPISSIKIDCPFVQGIGKGEKDEAIVKSIINIAKDLKITVVAEGIENENQLNFLIDHGCEFGQGFLFSKPLNADEMTALLNQ